MHRFDVQVAVGTGAAGAIGMAAATRFGQEGARVVAVDLAGSALDEAVPTLRDAGADVIGNPADVTQAGHVAEYVAAGTFHFGGIDILVNSARIEGRIGPGTDYPENVFDRVLAVNVKGVWLGTTNVVPAMRDRGGNHQRGIRGGTRRDAGYCCILREQTCGRGHDTSQQPRRHV